MQVRKLDMEQVRKIYYEDMVHQFPPEETKPYSSMKELDRRGMYLCYGLYEDETLLAYAFFVCEEAVRQILLDYYVVCGPYRNRGIGGEFLRLLKEECRAYDAMLIEVENPAFAADAEELGQQRRRVAFYARNGFRETEIWLNLFDMEYVIMEMDIAAQPDDKTVFAALDRLYRDMMGEWYAEELFYHEREARDGA